MSAPIEGVLKFGLRVDGDRITGADIQSTRPLQATRIFSGKLIDELLRILPSLYSVCATAQGTAAVRACEAAAGLRPQHTQESARDVRVILETAREHLWRILLTWPPLLGEEPTTAVVSVVPSLLTRASEALYPDANPIAAGGERLKPQWGALDGVAAELEMLLQQHVFGCLPAQWHAMTKATELEAWAERTDTIAARFVGQVTAQRLTEIGRSSISPLPQMTVADLDRRLSALDADAFIAEPQWEGRARETSALTRQRDHPLVMALASRHDNGLLTRLAAGLLELADTPRRMQSKLRVIAATHSQTDTRELDEDGTGISQVEAARGRLIHRVELTRGRVARYQILAPTEWNFHPQGPAAKGLLDLAPGDESSLLRQAQLLISAVDPCVRYELTVK